MEMDLKRFEGRPLSELVEYANEKTREGNLSLEDGLKLFKFIMEEPSLKDMHYKGILAQVRWGLEKRLGMHDQYFSQAGQDKFIAENIFGMKKDGVFVEIGAFDGLRGSNCLFFEKFLGWGGLIVEPDKNRADEIKRFRSATFENIAISDRDGDEEFLAIEEGFLQMGGLLKFYDKKILENDVRSNKSHREQITRIEARSLNSLLEKHAMFEVDYCSIDVEGAEEGVISQFDFGRFDIKVMSIENAHHGTSIISGIMEKNSYALKNILGADEIWSKI